MHKRVFYGWFVVAAAFVATLLGFGSAYTFSVFVAPLQHDFGVSRGAVSLVFSLAGFLYFGLGVVTGPLADRFGARRLVFAGMVLTGAGLVLAGYAQTLWQVCLAYGLGVGLGNGCAYVPVLGTVQRWFSRRRGLASGLAVSGIGVGTLVMPPLAAWLIATIGWRDAYLALGYLVALLGGAMALLVVDDPAAMGLAPDGDGAPEAAPRASGMALGTAVRSSAFLRLYASCLLCSVGAFVPFAHLVPSALASGVPNGVAVMLLAVIGVGSTAGRFFLGGFADRVGRTTALSVMLLGMAGAQGIWAVASGTFGFAAFAFVYGVFYGGWVAVLPTVVMDLFGGRNVSGLIGFLATGVAIGTLVGPSAAGFIFDATHSYGVPILISAATTLLSAAAVGRRGLITCSGLASPQRAEA